MEVLGVAFLYMEVGLLPVLKKAAPTKSFGLSFALLKMMLMPFLGSVGLIDGVGTGTALSNKEYIKLNLRVVKNKHK